MRIALLSTILLVSLGAGCAGNTDLYIELGGTPCWAGSVQFQSLFQSLIEDAPPRRLAAYDECVPLPGPIPLTVPNIVAVYQKRGLVVVKDLDASRTVRLLIAPMPAPGCRNVAPGPATCLLSDPFGPGSDRVILTPSCPGAPVSPIFQGCVSMIP